MWHLQQPVQAIIRLCEFFFWFGFVFYELAVGVMWYVWVFFTVPTYVIFTIPYIRRKYFEWFYFPHMIGSFVTVAGVLWHGNSACFFILPTIALYFIDRLIRFLNGTRNVKITRLEPVTNDVLKLCYEICDTTTKGTYKAHGNIIPACYVFVKIDRLSTMQWHPFSLFNSKHCGAGNENVIFIKRDGGYTDNLWKLALQNEIENNGSSSTSPEFSPLLANMQMSVDGPYGHEIEYSGYKHIIFICGGIGITPVHSVVASLLHEFELKQGIGAANCEEPALYAAGNVSAGGGNSAVANQSSSVLESDENPRIIGCNDKICGNYNQTLPYQSNGMVPQMTVVWSARDPQLFGICDDLYVNNNVHGHRKSKHLINFNLYLTREAKGVNIEFVENFKKVHKIQIRKGRPNLTETGVKELFDGWASDCLIWACGPNKMVQEARRVSKQLGTGFHSETFEF